ncbi:MAG: HAD-IG family 5'-nucleotidase [Silvanigrellaceae bacterium]|nr:HAD-IG family 5'-nucleotidase [Silvanigrellaceae bacterium]
MATQDKLIIPPNEKIFCNRSLNMKSIKAVGFDLDYTIALYKLKTFEAIAYHETLKKLVNIGYPSEVLNWKFDAHSMVRGLVIDKVRGNILKIDRHRYVKVAYHGFHELTQEERRNIYDLEKVLNYEEPDFVLIDTIFSLAEALLFAQLVDLHSRIGPYANKSFRDYYIDVKKSIDLCHRDGSIKLKVAQNPAHYIQKDPFLKQTLQALKSSGRKLFLLTNSLWDYSNVVMNYLFEPFEQEGASWLDYFEVVIVGAQKPIFFMGKNPLFEVDIKTGLLRNTDGIIGQAKVYQGGYFKVLHEIFGTLSGSEILYVGDHIYGDILRSKKEIGWRTMLIVEELEKEIAIQSANREHLEHYQSLCKKRQQLEEQLGFLKHSYLDQGKSGEKTVPENQEYLNEIKKHHEQINQVRLEAKQKLRSYHHLFHPVWGEVMKVGRQNSRFAAQVENYACLYTSKLSNLRHYSLDKSFQSNRDLMPHDQ